MANSKYVVSTPEDSSSAFIVREMGDSVPVAWCKDPFFGAHVDLPAESWSFHLANPVCPGFFLLSNGPVMIAIVQESGSDRPAYVNGIYMMINFLVGSGMTVLVGVLNDRLGLGMTYHLATFWFFGAIFCVPLLPGKLFARFVHRAKQ